MIPMNKTVTFG